VFVVVGEPPRPLLLAGEGRAAEQAQDGGLDAAGDVLGEREADAAQAAGDQVDPAVAEP
jgi:hypothetical protein